MNKSIKKKHSTKNISDSNIILNKNISIDSEKNINEKLSVDKNSFITDKNKIETIDNKVQDKSIDKNSEINKKNIHIVISDKNNEKEKKNITNNKSKLISNNFKTNILNLIHLIIFFLFITIPVYPYKLIKIFIFFPWIMSLIWVVFKGCPLNKYSDNKDGSFVYELLKLIFPNIDKKLVAELIIFISVSIVTICHIRIRINEK